MLKTVLLNLQTTVQHLVSNRNFPGFYIIHIYSFIQKLGDEGLIWARLLVLAAWVPWGERMRHKVPGIPRVHLQHKKEEEKKN